MIKSWPFLLCIAALVAACGGEERATAEPTQQSSESPASPESARSLGASPEGADEEPHSPLPPESVVQQLLGQRVLDHPEVQPYLHTEVAGNFPLSVHAIEELSLGAAALEAGGRSVRVVATAAEARFRFTAREDLEGPRVAVRFEIPAEGVAGRVILELRDFEWSVVEAEVVEH